MVAKLLKEAFICQTSIILAKIHMVAKLNSYFIDTIIRIILAKIHMVAKPQKYYSITFDIKIYQSFTF